MSRVSVLIAVHNAGVFLRQTVASVLAQTYSDFEIVVVDDGSTDGCDLFLDPPPDPRLRLVRQRQQGAPAALNTALAAAAGELIAFLDHDDLWLPGKLQAHVDTFDAHPDTDLTFDWSRRIDERDRDLGLPSRPWRGTIAFEELLDDFVIGNTSALVLRREAIGKAGPFDTALRRLYDLDLCLRIAAQRTGNCRAVPRQLTLYRRHAGQMSRDWRGLRAEWEWLLGRVPGYAPQPVDQVLPAADSNMRRYFAWLAAEQGEFAAALALQCSAFRRAPRHAFADVRNWQMLACAAGGLVLPRRAYSKLIESGKRMRKRNAPT